MGVYVTLRYYDHVGWKIISRLISLRSSLSADPSIIEFLRRKHPKFSRNRSAALHRRMSSVNFWGHKIFARKICIKISKMPEFYMILARKIIKYTRILYIFARKIFF